jgi:macrolide-specific efflux system membrane fusion protein
MTCRGFVAGTAGLLLVIAFAASSPAGESPVFMIDSVVLRPLVEAEVPARQLAVLARIAVDEGATVEADALLASLDDRVAALKVKQAELERDQAAAKAANQLSVQYADKALDVARAEYKRSQESNEKFPNSISNSQLDVERLTIEKLELERRQAEHELELARFDLELRGNALDAARLDLELHAVRAPFAGVVALVRGRAGEWVQPGTSVLRLVAIDRLRAEGFAPAEVVADSLLGEPVQFRLGGNSGHAKDVEMFEGRIGFVSPEVDPVTRQVRIWAEIENSKRRLRPGQQGQLQISP